MYTTRPRRAVQVGGEDALQGGQRGADPPRATWRTRRGRTAPRPRGRHGAPRRRRRTSSGGRRSTRTPGCRPGARTSRRAPSRPPRRSTAPAAARRSYSGTRRRPRGRLRLPERPVHGVEAAERLARALEQVAGVGLGRGEAADVHLGDVDGRRALVDPARQREADPGAEDDALRVHAGGDEQSRHLAGLAEDEVAVRREALRRAQVVREARLGERRNAAGWRRPAAGRSAPGPARTRRTRSPAGSTRPGGDARRARTRRRAGRRGSAARRWSRRGRG